MYGQLLLKKGGAIWRLDDHRDRWQTHLPVGMSATHVSVSICVPSDIMYISPASINVERYENTSQFRINYKIYQDWFNPMYVWAAIQHHQK